MKLKFKILTIPPWPVDLKATESMIHWRGLNLRASIWVWAETCPLQSPTRKDAYSVARLLSVFDGLKYTFFQFLSFWFYNVLGKFTICFIFINTISEKVGELSKVEFLRRKDLPFWITSSITIVHSLSSNWSSLSAL